MEGCRKIIDREFNIKCGDIVRVWDKELNKDYKIELCKDCSQKLSRRCHFKVKQTFEMERFKRL